MLCHLVQVEVLQGVVGAQRLGQAPLAFLLLKLIKLSRCHFLGQFLHGRPLNSFCDATSLGNSGEPHNV